ncbi:DUF883 family protein [Emcibacter sp.]|uniref:DUF883 family protein n=1 Tax=Emcibacter sp. TaxID=1979954 RepID=UPI003A8E650A
MTAVEKELKTLKKDFAELKEILAEQAKDKASNGHGRFHVTRDELQAMASRAGENVRDFITDKKERYEDVRDKCETTVKAHPFATTAAAFTGGLLIATLLRRK